LEGNVRDMQSIEHDLSPFLTGVSIQPEALLKDVTGTRTTLRREAMAYRDLKGRIVNLERAVHELKPKCAEAESGVKSTKRQAAECSGALAQRLRTLQQKLNERAALLGGEATDKHRTRFNEARLAAIAAQNRASNSQSEAASAHRGAVVASEQAVAAHAEAHTRVDETWKAFREACATAGRSCDWVIERLTMPSINRAETRPRLLGIEHALNAARGNVATRSKDLETALANTDESITAQELSASLTTQADEIRAHQQRFGEIVAELKRNMQVQDDARALGVEADAKREQLTVWQAVDDAVGSPDGSRFRKFVQSITLEHLIRLANDHLSALGPRYQLAQGITSDLAVHVVDRDMADELRAARSLSGGERFLVSLSLALALSGLEGRSSFVDTLFIDEGFGSLDQETLDIALNALESLHSRGRKVAVVTHVAAMIDRIAVQVRVEKLGGGNSVVRLADGLVA
jgi:exonuclease SbcC